MNRFMEDELSEQLHGPVKTTPVTVSGGPTLLPPTPLFRRKDVIVYNSGPSIIYMGDDEVTYETGIPVDIGGSFALPLARAQLFATVSGVGNDSVVRVLEAT